MKTHVIQLETFDDVVSIRDKMSWSDSARILLVWPSRGRVGSSMMDLRLLMRHAQALGAQVGLVTRNQAVRANAQHIGLPVFASTAEAQKATWRRGRRKRWNNPAARLAARARLEKDGLVLQRLRSSARENHWLLRVAAFSLGVVAVLAVILFFLPAARVTLVMPSKPQALEMEVRAGPGTAAASLSGGIPAAAMSVIVTAQAEVNSTGWVSLPGERASGQAWFTNLTDQLITVPAGTVVQSVGGDPLRFETSAAVEVPAGIYQAAEAPLRAVEAGSRANIAAGEIQAIEGTLGLQLSVTNPEATTGGTDLQAHSPADDDVMQLRHNVMAMLEEDAVEQVRAGLGEGQILLPASVQLDRILEEELSPGRDQPGDRVNLHIRAQYKGWYYQQADLENVVSMALNASQPEGWQEANGTLIINSQDRAMEFNPSTQMTVWKVQVGRLVKPEWDANRLVQELRGLPVDEAKTVLQENFRLEKAPVLSVSPTWWPRLPFLTARIEVDVR